jgi:hypothetical protein
LIVLQRDKRAASEMSSIGGRQTIHSVYSRKESRYNNIIMRKLKLPTDAILCVDNTKPLCFDTLFTCMSILSESEQLMMAQSRELDASLERAKGELETVQGHKDSLEEQLKTVQADFTSFKAVVDRTLQDVQKENESLKVKCNKKDRELEVCDSLLCSIFISFCSCHDSCLKFYID